MKLIRLHEAPTLLTACDRVSWTMVRLLLACTRGIRNEERQRWRRRRRRRRRNEIDNNPSDILRCGEDYSLGDDPVYSNSSPVSTYLHHTHTHTHTLCPILSTTHATLCAPNVLYSKRVKYNIIYVCTVYSRCRQ